MARTTQRPPNYAFSLHLHLDAPLAQRVLAQATKEGSGPMAAVLECLRAHLPRVDVRVKESPSAAGLPTPVKAPKIDSEWRVPADAWMIDFPSKAELERFQVLSNVALAVELMIQVSRNRAMGVIFRPADLFAPNVWKGMGVQNPAFRRALRIAFRDAVKVRYNGGERDLVVHSYDRYNGATYMRMY